MKKGDSIELDITGYAFEGKGVAKIVKEVNSLSEEAKKFVVFVNGAYPGDKINARITRVRKSYAEAEINYVLTKSAYRTDPRCKYFGTCGGCRAQDLEYRQQVKFKEEQVKEIFQRIGGFSDFEMLSILPAENSFFYRNKMEFSFSEKRWLTKNEIESMQEIQNKDFALGLHIPGMYEKVLDIDECFLQSELSNRILNFTRKFFKTSEMSIYSTANHSGFLRNLVIRNSYHTKDLMVNLVTAEENERLLINYSNGLKTHFPEITTIINNINTKKAQVATGDYEKVFYGSGFIYDCIGEYKFRISANSFFQTNTRQAEQLYQTAVDFAEFSGNEIVYDLYSGAGTIPVSISKFVKEIHGFESVEAAISDARVNAGMNNISNFRTNLCDLNKSFIPLIENESLPKPDVIIADPPRSGMNPKTVNDLISLKSNRIVYISCNPTTQARDLKLLCESSYKLIKLKPVDMFPHTYHIENVALLKLI